MSDLLVEFGSTKTSMEEIRQALDGALQQQFPGGMLRRQWEGDGLHLSARGASGTITVEGGRLAGKAALSPPASLMRGIIEEKISMAMRAAR